MNMNGADGKPENKYSGIKEKILSKISDQTYKDKIPSSRELAEEFNANIKTIDKAIKELEEEGVLERKKGKGTFIVDKDEKASGVINGKGTLIGVLSPDPGEMKDSWLSAVLSGVENVMRKANVNIVLKTYPGFDGLAEEKKAFNSLLDCGISGLIAYPQITRKGLSNASIYKKLELPFVLFDRYFDVLDSDYVGVDHYKVGRLAAECLVSKGHTRIAHIAPDGFVKNTEDRIDGFRDALRDSQIHLSENLCARFSTYIDSDMIKDFLRKIMGLGNDSATAIYASHDGYALAVYAAAKEEGLRIPEDISLVSFGNSVASGILGITSIDQALTETGFAAAEMLLARMNGNKKNRSFIHKVLSIQLMERNSVRDLKTK